MGCIRFLLALSVMLEHIYLSPKFVSGQTAVFAFFVISGFYMNLIITEQYKSHRKAFLLNRALRIYPSYYVIFLLTILAAYSTHVNHIMLTPAYAHQMTLPQLIWYRLTNIIIIGQDITANISPIFANHFNQPILPAWTLASELVFYLVISFFPLNKSTRIQLILFTIFLSLSIDGFYSNYRVPTTSIIYFMFGALSYYLYDYFKIIPNSLNTRRTEFLLFILTVGIILLDRLINFHFTQLAFVSLICIATPFIFNLTKNSQIDRIIGDLSFPIYISHMFCIFSFSWIFPGYSRFGLSPRTAIIVDTFAISLLLYYFVENPIEKYRKRIKGRREIIKESDIQRGPSIPEPVAKY